MKITNEQLLALQQNEALRKKQASVQGFDALLAEQFDPAQAQGVASVSGRPSGLAQGASLPGLEGLTGEAAMLSADLMALDMQEAAVRIDSLFSDMEKYAGELGSFSDDSLKKAYGLLEGMSSQVAQLRSSYPDMAATNPELASMVNELDVMTTTEMFKFNRGDYL